LQTNIEKIKKKTAAGFVALLILYATRANILCMYICIQNKLCFHIDACIKMLIKKHWF